ncbi:MAG: hypothetical protein ACK5MP_02990 [Nostocoides sp.]
MTTSPEPGVEPADVAVEPSATGEPSPVEPTSPVQPASPVTPPTGPVGLTVFIGVVCLLTVAAMAATDLFSLTIDPRVAGPVMVVGMGLLLVLLGAVGLRSGRRRG